MAAQQQQAASTAQDPTGATIDTDAFKKLYPRQFFERFIQEGVRPDGRTLGRARAVSIGLGAVSNSLGSALVKLGTTIVLAGVRAHTGECPEGKPNSGSINISVELAPFATSDTRSSQAQELLSCISQRLRSILQPMGLDAQLGIREGKAAFHVQLDVYILNADGAVLDAALLASIAALQDTRLPPAKHDKEQQAAGTQQQGSSEAAVAEVGSGERRQLRLPYMPVAVSCALFSSEHVLVDPTGEEEAVAQAGICVAVDAQGKLHGVYQSGGGVSATPLLFMRCIGAAKLRYKEVVQLLQQQLQEREAARAAAQEDGAAAVPMQT